MSDVQDRPLYSVKALAEKLSVSERQVWKLLSGEPPKIPSFKVGGQRRVAPADVDEYLQRQQS